MLHIILLGELQSNWCYYRKLTMFLSTNRCVSGGRLCRLSQCTQFPVQWAIASNRNERQKLTKNQFSTNSLQLAKVDNSTNSKSFYIR